jgi:hypothetical protein
MIAKFIYNPHNVFINLGDAFLQYYNYIIVLHPDDMLSRFYDDCKFINNGLIKQTKKA